MISCFGLYTACHKKVMHTILKAIFKCVFLRIFLTKLQIYTDVTINDYIGLVFIPILLIQNLKKFDEVGTFQTCNIHEKSKKNI